MTEDSEGWKRRVGSDSWRNAIRDECDHLAAVTLLRESKSDSGDFDINSPLDYQYLGSESNPVTASYLVAQTGRLFVIGPTLAAAQRLRVLEGGPPRHLQIVLLSWEWEHWDGLEQIVGDIAESSEDLKLTIWTSCWIWEEVTRAFPEDWDGAKQLRGMEYLVIQGDEAMELNPDGTPKRDRTGKIMAFERCGSWNLTCGVTFDLSYTIHQSPLLRARFRCNNERLSIDPSWLPLTANHPGRGEEILGQMQAVRLRHPDTARFLEEMRREIRELSGEAFMGMASSRGTGFASPVDRPPPAAIPRFTVNRNQPLGLSATANRPGTPQSSAAMTDNLVILMMCGGLMHQLDRNLIDPSHQLDIEVSDSVGAEVTRSMSILEWRLRQADSWHRDHGGKTRLPVVLLTTPETEDYVRAMKRRLSRSLAALELIPAAAQLIPGIRDQEFARCEDGGWILHPRGHLDALRFLANERERFKDRNLALIFAFNNLGKVFDGDATISRLKEFEDDESELCVELFRFIRQPGDNDKRWSQLSRAPDARRPRLIKESYFGAGENRPKQVGVELCYSSLTWYAKLPALWDEGTTDCFDRLGFTFHEDLAGELMPRQDIDLVTHSDHLRTSGLDLSFTMKNPETSPPEGRAATIYTHLGYLGVRTLDHVRHHQFVEQFKGVGVCSAPDAKDMVTPPDDPIWELVPQEQRYAWGGYDIAMLKGSPRALIAETWEVSTYQHVQSAVAVNAEHTVRLESALKGRCDAILKYVDCHTALSLQVHPLPAVAKSLAKKYPVRDTEGKDETFFVLDTAPGREFHLLLGFDRDQLAPLAEAVRPILLQDEYHSEREDSISASADRLVEVLQGEYLGEIKKYLTRSTPFTGELSGAIEETAKEFIQDCMRFQNRKREEEADDRRLLGKEFLFAGTAVIGLLYALHKYFTKRISESRQESDLKSMTKLFGGDLRERATAAEMDAHPILRLFCRLKVEKNSWIRIPAGTVHSLQGGGSRFIEIGHASDNTFRMLDFGREPDGARELHYHQAACSLNSFAFFDEESVKRFVEIWQPSALKSNSPEDTKPDLFVDCHQLMRSRLWDLNDADKRIDAGVGLSFLMNPDGGATLTVRRTGHAPHRREINGMRTVAIRPVANEVEVEPQQGDNRIIQFLPRTASPPLICFCPGAVGSEFGIWRDELARPFERAVDDAPKFRVANLLAALTRIRPDLPKHGRMRVALAWPGFIQNPSKKPQLHSSTLQEKTPAEVEKEITRMWPGARIDILSDFHFSLLGELSHPMGRLSPDQPGMLINIGSGICVAFHHPEIEGGLDQLFRDEWLTVCSGVGRWLFVNEKTRRWQVGHSSETNGSRPVSKHLVFREPKGENKTKPWIRASNWFSARALIGRWENTGVPEGAKARELESALLNIWNEKPKNGASEFAMVLAGDLATVVLEVVRMLRRQLSPLKAASSELKYSDYRRIVDECPRNIVLTGFVGQYFGRHSDEPTADLLTAILQQRLDELFPGPVHRVMRSDISSVAERETHGALYYFNSVERGETSV